MTYHSEIPDKFIYYFPENVGAAMGITPGSPYVMYVTYIYHWIDEESKEAMAREICTHIHILN